ncbi:4-alpha-N-acetylgalactosaminyltransferase [Clostridium homopropionicum DSM 5847]|uniref:4-alpha-N-acetylgalactosaminyltransferase n=1 Tax=Clostridium homopropionicum DSM 5847 TaxID=1121318 RepID=A0A0L6ZBU5_9CLOT|nr:glycosyltransferase [Clostridium homopropionicum]KOA20253.1 4-alpha-N-acetylgalactosaminyltransferase [Clostridium homopropionicum DSM 5847]SFG57490.1 Glycosyltransferase involved in cell wall bisynthesis [Clostridium homopropionicum]
MKVLLCTRQDYNRNIAGDSTQVLKTAKYLDKLGVEVSINNGCIFDYYNYDIIHLFNINKIGDIYNYYKIAHKYKKKIVISPVYHNPQKYLIFKDYKDKLKLWEASNAYRKEIFMGSTAIITNSISERENIIRDFNIKKKFNVIYNGVEVEDEQVPLYSIRERYNLNSYVLSVGKICSMKNQHIIAKICNELDIQLLLIGRIKESSYYKECMKYKNVLYLGFMDSYNIYNAYRFAKLHVKAGFFEMPGFSSLEAAASGCNIVTTSEGCAKEYFKDLAIYCNPYDENSIYESIRAGLKMHKAEKLKELVKKEYTWEKYTNQLYETYKKLI